MSSNRATVFKQRVEQEQFYQVALFKLAMDNASNHPANQPFSRKHKGCHLQVGSESTDVSQLFNMCNIKLLTNNLLLIIRLELHLSLYVSFGTGMGKLTT